MKNNTNIQNKEKRNKIGLLAMFCIILFALALGVSAFASTAFAHTPQKAERNISGEQSSSAIYNTALTTDSNSDISLLSDNADFQMTLSRNTLTATWPTLNYVGWVWRLLTCEGVREDYWKVMTGTNYKETTLKMTSTTFTYDLATLVDSGVITKGKTYSVALYGVSNDGSMFQGSNVITYMYQEPVTLPPNPTKEGYTFVGWYYGTESEHGSNCQAYDNAPIYSDTALHAHFTINTYRVTFDSAGGNDIAAQTVNWNTKPTLTTPERMGYRFLGWFTSSGTQFTTQTIKENTTLVAHWEIITYTVTFYVDSEVYKTLTVEYGTTLQAAAERANMTYYNLYSESGVKMSKASVVSEDMELNAVAMSDTEKATTFLANTWWIILIALGVAALLIVAIVYTVKRGARSGK